MSKRFLDTEMPLRPWYRSLPPRLKCLWTFMLCRCDLCGVLDMDWDLASFSIGEKVNPTDLEAMNGNVTVLPSGKLYLPGFVAFQYGELKDESRVHIGVRKALEMHGIDGQTLSIGFAKGYITPKDKDKAKDKAKNKAQDKEGGCKGGESGEPPPAPKPKTFKTWNRGDLESAVKSENADELLTPAEVEDFVGYWMEPSATGRPRIAMERTWDTRRRMQTAVRVVFERQRVAGNGGWKPRSLIDLGTGGL